ncbi:MAG TPA: hypothetical protein V6D30_18700, partial [Leptolyngbyaceae cyanobacterium]
YHTLDTPSSFLTTPIQVIVNKLGIWRGGLLGKTLFTSGFGGACRPLKSPIPPWSVGRFPVPEILHQLVVVRNEVRDLQRETTRRMRPKV